ncbi:MAG TPA: RNA 2',3'-cyclic phosphodiesterase [Thermoplasmata archaeon]|nr:RNA 2',3'-cyclic phosphodiesterase [Thermoplasmata archaeon]
MRLFVAVDLVPPVGLVELVGRLPPHFHATLRFFGDLPEESVGRLVGAVEAAGLTTPGFDLELRGIGAFPSPRRPRVLWVGFGRGREEIERLADRLEAGLAAEGFAPDPRSFQPHATLSRIRHPAEQAEAVRLLERGASVSFGLQPVAEIAVYESRLAPGGADHRRVAAALLAPRG